MALSTQSDGFAFFDAGRDCDVQRLPRLQGDADRAALRNRRQGDRDRNADIFPPGLLAARAGAAGAEQFRQDVGIDRAAFGGEPAAAEVEAEIAEFAAPSSAGLAAKTEPLELGRARLAVRVDLAAVEGLALLVVAEDLVGRAHLGEALFRLRLLALVGMVSLGELAERG